MAKILFRNQIYLHPIFMLKEKLNKRNEDIYMYSTDHK